jgi:hypothetical protein
MRPYKGHAATEIRDRVSNTVGRGPIGSCGLLQLHDRLDIALGLIFDSVRLVIVVVIGFRAFGGWIHGYDFVFLLMCSSKKIINFLAYPEAVTLRVRLSHI